MLLQKEIESKIIAAFSAALTAASVTDCRVGGAWQPVASGLSKWTEDDSDSAAFLNVAVGTPSRDTYSDPTTEMAAKIALFIRPEKDVTGDLLVSIAEVVQARLDAWQAATYQKSFTDFNTTNFSLGDLSVSAGSSPAYNGSFVTVEYPFTIMGCMND